MAHRIEVLGPNAQAEALRVRPGQRRRDPDDLAVELDVREDGPEVARDAEDPAALVDDDPVGRGDCGQRAVGEAELAPAASPDPAMADDRRGHPEGPAPGHRREHLELDGTDGPPAPAL